MTTIDELRIEALRQANALAIQEVPGGGQEVISAEEVVKRAEVYFGFLFSGAKAAV